MPKQLALGSCAVCRSMPTATRTLLHFQQRLFLPIRLNSSSFFCIGSPVKRIVFYALTASLLLVLTACTEAPAPTPAIAAPVLQGRQLRFAPDNPQLALLGVSTAAASKTLTTELPARLVWNEEHTQRIYPTFAGRVTAIKADVGQSVQPGRVLAQLASPDFGIA